MRKTLFTAAAAAAVAVGLLVPPAGAARPNAPACGDIVGGAGDYQRLVLELVQEEIAPGVYKQAHNSLLPRGVLTVDLQLAAASCADVTYLVQAFSSDAQGNKTLIASNSRPGDGSSTVVILETVVNALPSNQVHVQVMTLDRRGQEIDLGSDAGPVVFTARSDGGPGGPGNVGWS